MAFARLCVSDFSRHLSRSVEFGVYDFVFEVHFGFCAQRMIMGKEEQRMIMEKERNTSKGENQNSKSVVQLAKMISVVYTF